MTEQPDDTNKIRIEFHEDEIFTVVFEIDSPESALDAAIQAKEIAEMVRIAPRVKEIRSRCKEEDELLVFPKPSGVSEEVRLAACAAAAFPDGFPQEAIKSKLDISDSSRDAYINWDTKTSSEFLHYDSGSRKIFTTVLGVEWVYQELQSRGAI